MSYSLIEIFPDLYQITQCHILKGSIFMNYLHADLFAIFSRYNC